MTKQAEFVKFMQDDSVEYERRSVDFCTTEILQMVRQTVCTYTQWRTDRLGDKVLDADYSDFDNVFTTRTRRMFNVYSPVISPEDGRAGLVEVEALNKSKQRQGKRITMKLGRFLSTAFPFLRDDAKEHIVTNFKDLHGICDAEFAIAESGFGKIVTMKHAANTYLDTNMRRKSLDNSCMRYEHCDLGFHKHHPYDAYESGDFGLAYLHKDNKLFARSLVHYGSKTYSAIYAASNAAYETMVQELKDKNYRPCDPEGEDWQGAKLVYLTDSLTIEDEEIEDMDVIIVPYIDFLSDEDGFTDGEYIWINYQPYDDMRVVDLQCAGGYNELY